MFMTWEAFYYFNTNALVPPCVIQTVCRLCGFKHNTVGCVVLMSFKYSSGSCLAVMSYMHNSTSCVVFVASSLSLISYNHLINRLILFKSTLSFYILINISISSFA